MDAPSRHLGIAPSTVEEEAGVLKSGLVTAGFSPIKSKKVFYAVLCDRALELHESEKSQKKKKHARYLIDLSTCFNISRHFDTKLRYCVSVMTPDETLLLRGEADSACDEWYEMLMSALIPARALRLGRPVLASEFFECAWDVVLVENPKLKKPVPNPEKMPNMCKKDPSLAGPHRLCFYPHTIILCRRGIEPAAIQELPPSGIPPFRLQDFIEFPRKFVANFGCQEKFFIMRMGRSSPSGSSEMWAQCENEETAADIHTKLNKIIEREGEKKKQIVNGPMLRPNLAASSHLERSQGSRQRISSLGNTSVSSEMSLRERRAQLRDSKAAVDSFEERVDTRTASTPSAPVFTFESAMHRLRTNSPGSFSGVSNLEVLRRKCSVATTSCASPVIWNHVQQPPARAHSICAHNSFISPPAATYVRSRKKSAAITEELSLGNFHHLDLTRRRASFASSVADETEDSGGTLRIMDADEQSSTSKWANDREIEATIERMMPDELRKGLLVDDSDGVHSESDSEHLNRPDSHSAACSTCTNDDFASLTPGDISEDTSGDNFEYAPMEMNSWSSGSTSHLAVPASFEQQYNLEEVRSYVSDSSDSCYSSMAPNGAPRAYSFGSHVSQHPRHVSRRHRTDDGSPLLDSTTSSTQNGVHQRGGEGQNSLLALNEDPRKRAFSLGSKSWFQKPFRKMSRDLAARAQRHANTSAASLSGSSTGVPPAHCVYPSNLPAVPPIQAYIAQDPYPYSRVAVRSDSIGSGRSTPYTRRSIANAALGDHVQLDFGGTAPLGRSASGSVHSADSPSRSRTSSFGCGQRHSQSVRDPGEIVIHSSVDIDRERSPRQGIAIKPSALSHDIGEDNDYVGRSVGDCDDYVLGDVRERCALVVASACCQLDPSMAQMNICGYPETYSSQVFDTIQEINISARSSRASSRCSNQSARIRRGSSIGATVKSKEVLADEGERCVASSHSVERGRCSTEGTAQLTSGAREGFVRGALLAAPECMSKRCSVPSLVAAKVVDSTPITRDDSDLKYVLLEVAKSDECVRRSRSKSGSASLRDEDVDYVEVRPPEVRASS